MGVRSLVIILFSLLSLTGKTQTDAIEVLVKALEEQRKENPAYINISAVYKYKEKQEILGITSGYATDSIPRVRQRALSIAAQNIEESNNSELRQQTAELLCSATNDGSASVRQTVFTYLQTFRRPDFTPKAVNSIRRNITSYPYKRYEIIRLLGFIGDNSDIRTLKNMQNLSSKENWSKQVALARLGDSESLDFCLERIKSMPLNDDWTYNVAEELVYFRQRKAMDMLVQALQNKEKNCSSPNPDSDGKIQCGYRIMELIANYIIDFPLQTDISGDIDCDNYPRCLEKARDWFTANPGYGIDYSKY